MNLNNQNFPEEYKKLALLWLSEYLVEHFSADELSFLNKDGLEYEQELRALLNNKINKDDLQSFYLLKINEARNLNALICKSTKSSRIHGPVAG